LLLKYLAFTAEDIQQNDVTAICCKLANRCGTPSLDEVTACSNVRAVL
jgi:hypothetical protein